MSATATDDAWRARAFAPAPGTRVCTLGEVPDGGAREFRFGEGREAFRLLVFRQGATVRGYVNFCPHFSLPLNTRPDHFLIYGDRIYCANHTAIFRIADGYCEDGPCTGSWLEKVPLALAGDEVSIAR